jgi:hypothetical protein
LREASDGPVEIGVAQFVCTVVEQMVDHGTLHLPNLRRAEEYLEHEVSRYLRWEACEFLTMLLAAIEKNDMIYVRSELRGYIAKRRNFELDRGFADLGSLNDFPAVQFGEKLGG